MRFLVLVVVLFFVVDSACGQPDLQKRRPLVPGTSISIDKDAGPGTITCMVKDGAGNKYAMTNAHVVDRPWKTGPGPLDTLADPPKSGPNTYAINPAGFNGGQRPADIIGFGSKSSWGDGIDAAIIALCTGAGAASGSVAVAPDCPGAIQGSNAFAKGEFGSIAGVEGVGTLAVNDVVWKVGAMSGKTVGKIVEVAGKAPAHLRDAQQEFTNQIIVESTENKAFQDPGDSGAALMKGDKIIGILHAAQTNNRAVATPIETAFQKLGVQLDVPPVQTFRQIKFSHLAKALRPVESDE